MGSAELGRTFSAGEIICTEGDKADEMYVIQSGEVEIIKKAASGETVLARLGSGDIFGEMALFEKLPRSATARASGDTSILSIDRQKMFSMISGDPTLAFKIISSMSHRIRVMNEEMTKLKGIIADAGDLEDINTAAGETFARIENLLG